MARYCFYCGRELSAGERCTCRGAQARHSAQSSAGNGGSPAGFHGSPAGEDIYRDQAATGRAAGEEDAAASRRARKKAAWQAEKAERRQARETARQFKQDRKVRTKQERAAGKKAAAAVDWRGAFMAFGKNILQALTRPTAFIQDASHPTLMTAVITQIIEAALIAFTLLRVLVASNIGNLLIFGNDQLQARLGMSFQLLFFFQLFVVSVSFYAVRMIIINVLLRISRIRMHLLGTIMLLTPGSIYFCLFLVAGIMLSAGSGIQTLILVIGGYGVRFLVDHIAIRMETALSEDHMVRFSLLNFLLAAIILGSLISMLVPNLSGFQGNIPGDFA